MLISYPRLTTLFNNLAPLIPIKFHAPHNIFSTKSTKSQQQKDVRSEPRQKFTKALYILHGHGPGTFDILHV